MTPPRGTQPDARRPAPPPTAQAPLVPSGPQARALKENTVSNEAQDTIEVEPTVAEAVTPDQSTSDQHVDDQNVGGEQDAAVDPVDLDAPAGAVEVPEQPVAPVSGPDSPDSPDSADSPDSPDSAESPDSADSPESADSPDSPEAPPTAIGEPALTDGEAAPAPAPATSERGRRESGHDSNPDDDALEAEGDIAADYLEELLDIADLDGDIDINVEGGRAHVSIVTEGREGDKLVGRDGEVLDALQELARLAVMTETGHRSRLMLDVAGHRERRRAELTKVAEEAIAEVKESGQPERLAPMNPFERKIVHDVVAAAGLTSESEGAEPKRYVVVLPA